MLSKKTKYISLILLLIGVFITTPLLASKYLVDTSSMLAVSATATTTNSTCRNSGTATITPTGGTAPYQYQIITKPAAYTLTTSIQNSNVFNNLAIGNYSVRVTDNLGVSADVNFTVRGSEYRTMELILSTSINGCGNIVVNARSNFGVGAKRYYVVSGPNITQETELVNGIFETIHQQTYRFKVVDECNEVVIRDYIPERSVRHYYIVNNFSLNYDRGSLTCNNGQINLESYIDFSYLQYNNNGALVNESLSIIYPNGFTYRLFVNGVEVLEDLYDRDDMTLKFKINNFSHNTTYNYYYEFDFCGGIQRTNTKEYVSPLTIISSAVCGPSSTSSSKYTVRYPYSNSVTEYRLRLESDDSILGVSSNGIFTFHDHPLLLNHPLERFYVEAVHNFGSGCSVSIKSPNTQEIAQVGYINELVHENSNCFHRYYFCNYFDFVSNSNNLYKYQFSSTADFSNIILEKQSVTVGPTYFYNNEFPQEANYYIRIVKTDINGLNPIYYNLTNYVVSNPVAPNPNNSVSSSTNNGGLSSIIGTAPVVISVGAEFNPFLDSTVKVELYDGPSTFTTFDGRVISFNYPYELEVDDPSSLNRPGRHSLNYKVTLFPGEYKVRVTQTHPCYETRESIRDLIVPGLVNNVPKYNFMELLDFRNLNHTISSECGGDQVNLMISHDGFTNPIENHRYVSFQVAKLDEQGNIISFIQGPPAPYVYRDFNTIFSNLSEGRYGIYLDYGNASGRAHTVSQDYLDPLFDLSHTSLYKLREFTVYPYVESSIKGITSSGCATGTRNVVVEPDLRATTAPYTYRISSGPSGISQQFQSSNVFTNLTVGDYTFVMKDNCGNERTLRTSIEKFIPPVFETVGSTCLGESVTFTFPNYSYYTYEWTLPNGTVYTGNELQIDNVTNANVGNYEVKFIANVDGCISEATKMYYLDPCNGLIEIKKNHARVNPNQRVRFVK